MIILPVRTENTKAWSRNLCVLEHDISIFHCDQITGKMIKRVLTSEAWLFTVNLRQNADRLGDGNKI